MTTDRQTDVQATRDILRAFLDLPAGTIPAAHFVDANEPGNAWDAIREYMLDDLTGCGVEVRLHADRPGWESVSVTLV